MNSIEFIAFRGDEYPQVRERCRQLCAVAQAAGCPTVILVPSVHPGLSTTWEEVVDEYVSVLRDLSDVAESFGTKLAFEFLGFGWCSVRTPRGAYEIVQATDRDNLGLVFDIAHFHTGGGLLSEIDALDPEKIYSVHLNDLENVAKEAVTLERRLLPGLGVVPLDDICARLSGIGYDGFCAIEVFRPEYWEWSGPELAQSAREAALRTLTPHFGVR